MELLLASASPRRKQLLSEITSFRVVPSSYEEHGEGTPGETALKNACGKAFDVFSKHPDCLVLGADTVVALDGEIFGKPTDEADAKRILSRLSGKTHSVYTGVCLIKEGCALEKVVETRVTFRTLSEEEIQSYIESGLPFGKAGAYGIQDGDFVKSYEGSYTNVVGLPTETVEKMLAAESFKVGCL